MRPLFQVLSCSRESATSLTSTVYITPSGDHDRSLPYDHESQRQLRINNNTCSTEYVCQPFPPAPV